MDIKIENYIVLEPSMSIKDMIDNNKYDNDGVTAKYTASGTKFIPINTIIPVIKKGKACIGLGKVIRLVITGDTTSIYFEMVERKEYPEYYNLYRNQNSSGVKNTFDSYDEYDQIIPGAFTASKANAETTVRRKKRPTSFIDSDADYFDDIKSRNRYDDLFSDDDDD